MSRPVAYRELTLQAVRNAALRLMQEHGATTTLEVKNRLRGAGFWALQAEVSCLMRLLAEREGWQVSSTGRFRLYRLPEPDAAPAVVFWPAFMLN